VSCGGDVVKEGCGRRCVSSSNQKKKEENSALLQTSNVSTSLAVKLFAASSLETISTERLK
jgi:hypothetical protein